MDTALESPSRRSGVPPRPEFSGILRDHDPFAAGDPDDLSDRFNGWFDRIMLQSGLTIAPTMMLALCGCAAVAGGSVALVLFEDLLAVAIGTLVGFLLPIAAILFQRNRRQQHIAEQLPPMIDELSRAARTGRSLENCLEIVAADTPAPLGDELTRTTRRVKMGLSVSESIRDLPERTGLVATSVLTTALAVHEQTGGDLVGVLDRLSRTLRDRAQFMGRLRAATAASKATAVLMIGLPVAIVLFFTLRDPDYVSALMASRWGMMTTGLAIVLQVIGSIVVLAILSRSQRG